MEETESVRWGHFLLRVRQGPQGAVWSIEDLTSGETSAPSRFFSRANARNSSGSRGSSISYSVVRVQPAAYENTCSPIFVAGNVPSGQALLS